MNKAIALAAVAAILTCVSSARATVPDEEAVQCLTKVLLTAPNAISVKPADDWKFNYPDENYWSLRKGVEYTFRKVDGTEQTVGVYIETEFVFQSHDARNIQTLPPCCFVPADNGRFSLMLRPPFPASWYPTAKEVFIPPNGTEYVKQDSKDHPLYSLWSKLESECKIDNQEVNSPMVP